jgi:hypothetical protein
MQAEIDSHPNKISYTAHSFLCTLPEGRLCGNPAPALILEFPLCLFPPKRFPFSLLGYESTRQKSTGHLVSEEENSQNQEHCHSTFEKRFFTRIQGFLGLGGHR